jgi:putative intracellular protease/amidase
MARVLIALPAHGFDATEAATPWHHLVEAGVEVVFATPDGPEGGPPACDPLTLTGALFGQIGAKPPARARYARMAESEAFRRPIAYAAIAPEAFDGLLLPGGHAPGMRPYLEHPVLQEKVVRFMRAEKLVASICHGPLVLGRAIDPETGRSVAAGYTLTALPGYLERLSIALTSWKLGDHFRTYPTPVEDELSALLGPTGGFRHGPPIWAPYVHRDRQLLTARWPEDAEALGQAMVAALREGESAAG